MTAVRSTSVTFQPYAECAQDGCAFTTPQGPTARGNAKNHVDSTGHHVRVITERVDLYVPKEEIR